MTENSDAAPPTDEVRKAEIPLERDNFMRSLLGHLTQSLQEVVGMGDAGGFVSVVGQKIGDEINESYKRALAVDRLSQDQVAEVLVDLKRRIHGDFYVIEESDEKIVLGNRACPFGDKVVGRPALCMMTSNVFGVIAADNLGYARVDLEETIAEGHGGCRVVVYLKPGSGAADDAAREYYGS